MTETALKNSRRAFFAELENAMMKERLEKIRRLIQRKAPDIYDLMEAKHLFENCPAVGDSASASAEKARAM